VLWSNRLAVDGSMEVRGVVNPTPPTVTTSLTGQSLVVSWPADRLGWVLETRTNHLTIGLNTNWIPWRGSHTNTSVAIPVSPGNPAVFMRLVLPWP
jgi:hypothetical protein